MSTNRNLYIGFATEFFTLWTVTSEETFAQNSNGQAYSTGHKVSYFFHQNLSKDESKAIAKAKSLGCVNLTPDPELYGRNRSFESYRENIAPELFRFGKYKGCPIADTTDFKYLEWYINECRLDQREIVGKLIAENSDRYVWKNGELVDVEIAKQERDRQRLFNKIRKAGTIEFFNERNIRVDGVGFNTFFIPELNRAFVIDQSEQPVNVYEYRGFEYGLPGGTRIKNKDVRVTFRFDPDFSDPDFGFESEWDKLLITKIEKI